VSGPLPVENSGLRLFQLAAQANALLSSVDTALAYQPTMDAPEWMCSTIVELFREVENSLPDKEYFRHMSEIDSLMGKKTFKKSPSLFELRAVVACAQCAAD